MPPFPSLTRSFLTWHKNHPLPRIPSLVAITGAGSESRTPFTHFGNVVPVYLFALQQIDKLANRSSPPHKARKSSLRVLDHGTGTGRLLAFLADQFPQVKFVGTDDSPACIQFAITHYSRPNLQFISPSSQLATYNSPFDLVISSHVLEHVPPRDISLFLSQLKSRLSPKGSLILGTPNRKWFQDLYRNNPSDLPYNRLVLPHEHEYTYTELHTLLSSHFKSVSIHGLKNPANATFSHLSIGKLRQTTNHPLINYLFYLFRKFAPFPLVDFLGRHTTQNFLKSLQFDLTDLLIQNQPVPKYRQGLNFIAICSN